MSDLQIHAHLAHHAQYVNAVRAAGEFEGLEDAIRRSGKNEGLARSANQAWNHHLLWHSLSPSGGGPPTMGRLAQSVPNIVPELRRAMLGVWGSGWVWVVLRKHRISVESTQNEQRPQGYPLLCFDLWEHAYYVDHFGDRSRYADVLLSQLVNWEFAEARIDGYTPPELQ
jgi:Fe-Mn family superoxide dismutase